MTKKLKLAAAAALVSVGAVISAQAVSTNILSTVSVAFTVYSEISNTNPAGTVITDRIETSALNSKSLIKALATDPNVTIGSFSANAYLAVATPITNNVREDIITGGTVTHPRFHTNFINNITEGASSLVIVDGATVTPVPTSDVVLESVGSTLTSGNFNTNGAAIGATPAAKDSIKRLLITIPGQWNLDLQGWTTRRLVNANVGTGAHPIEADAGDGTSALSGFGTDYVSNTNGANVLVKGTLSINFFKVLKQ